MTFTTDIRLKRVEDDLWKSEDGRIEIHHDHTYETWCDDPHPVRIRKDSIHAEFQKRQAEGHGCPVKETTKFYRNKNEYVTYYSFQCPGGCEHSYSMWTVMIDDDWTDDAYETFGSARQAVEQLTGQKTIATKTPKVPSAPETYENPNGTRTWARCGHPAEFDINMDCYVCHEKP